MPSQTCLVIGASRGIGYGLVEQLSADSSNKVIATVCKPFDFGKSNVETLVLDQSSTSSVQDAASKLSTPIDTLILNAAIGLDEALLSTSEDRLNEYLNTNILGVQRVVNAFLPALRRGTAKKIVIITSYSGSNTAQRGAEFGLRGPYAVTKTANNMQAVQLHNELRGEGFVVAPVHPGWVSRGLALAQARIHVF